MVWDLIIDCESEWYGIRNQYLNEWHGVWILEHDECMHEWVTQWLKLAKYI